MADESLVERLRIKAQVHAACELTKEARLFAEAADRIESLEADRPALHYESNGEAGDGQTVCDVCKTELDEPHSWAECVECLLKSATAASNMVIGELEKMIEVLEAENESLRQRVDALTGRASPRRGSA
jgi:DNA repair exonuclease SbcCD ATPase subunit